MMEKLFENPETVSIRYIVDDIAASVDFYTQLLGFEVVMSPPNGFAMLSKGNLRLLLNQPGAGGAGQPMPDGTAPGPGGWNRLQLQTANLEFVVSALKKEKVKFRNEIVSANAGKQILLLDPAGNLVELFEPKS